MRVEAAEDGEAAEAAQLFDDLQRAGGDVSAALLLLLEQRDFPRSDPAYCAHLRGRLGGKAGIGREEFVAALLCPPDYGPDDIPELKALFQVLDPSGRGSVSAAEFARLFAENAALDAPPGFEDAVGRCFERLAALYGNQELTVIEFLQAMTAPQQAVNR